MRFITVTLFLTLAIFLNHAQLSSQASTSRGTERNMNNTHGNTNILKRVHKGEIVHLPNGNTFTARINGWITIDYNANNERLGPVTVYEGVHVYIIEPLHLGLGLGL